MFTCFILAIVAYQLHVNPEAVHAFVFVLQIRQLKALASFMQFDGVRYGESSK